MTDPVKHLRQLAGIAHRSAANCPDDDVVVTWSRDARPDRRMRFETRDMKGPDYWRIEEQRDGDDWRTVGIKAVNDVTVECSK